MYKKLKVCLIVLLAIAVVVQYSFTPQILTAYGEDGEQTQTAKVVEETTTSAPEPKEKATEPATKATEPATQAPEPVATAAEPTKQAESADPAPESDGDSSEAAPSESVDVAAPSDDSGDADSSKPQEADQTAGDSEDAVESEKAEADEEEADEEEYPAQSFSGSAGGVSVTINAPKGALPKGTKMKVSAVSASAVQDIVESAIGGDAATIKAADISFHHKGKEIEPKKSVSVRLTASGMNADASKKVVHISDGGAANVVTDNVTAGGAASFKASDFSIYLVVDEDQQPLDENAVATYEFYVEDELVQTQYIKTGDKLTDPGSMAIGADDANTVFKGWFVRSSGDEVDFGTTQTVDVTETIEVDAKIQHTYYVTFWGEADDEGNRGIVAVKSVTVEGSESGTVDTTDVSVTPKADTSAFKGWALDEEGSEMAEDSVDVSGRMDLYAVIIDAHWLYFDENVPEDSDSDATYTGPVFVADDEARSDKKPADPERKGYEFGGWYLDKDCNEEFDWTETGLDEDTTLYAKWEPGEALFHVIVWKQKITDARDAEDAEKTYDFELSAEWTGETGDTIDISEFDEYEALPFTGFHYNRMEASPETIRADGTSVINVYYDRNLLKINFVDGTDLVYREATNNNGTQYGYVDDNYIQLERHGNGANIYWTYDVTHNYSGTTYRQANNNQGTQYGFVDGQMVQLTYHQQLFGGYWTYGNNVRYNGTRYLQNATGNSGYGVVDGELVGISRQSGQWVYVEEVRYTETRYVTATEPHVETIEGLYGQTLAQNGHTWPGDRAWYQNPNGTGTRLTFLDAFKFEGLSGVSENNTVLTQYGANLSGNNTIRFYKQNVDRTWPANNNPTDSIGSGGGTFTITEKYEGFTAVQYAHGGTWSNGGAGTSTSATNLQIRFARQEFTLTFMSDGEEVGTKDNIPYEAELAGYQIDDPEKAHYNFEGWFEDPAGQVEFDWSSKMPAANKVVYAKWTPKQYHVSLDPNGGTLIEGQVAEFNVPLDTIISKSSLLLTTRPGYELIGWFDVDTGEPYGYGKVEDDVNLIAKWRYPGQVEIVYANKDDEDYGSGLPEDTYKYATDSSVVLGAPPSEIEPGYAFVGWEVDGKRYYTNNTFDITSDMIEDYDEETKTGTVTIYAIYQNLKEGAYTPTTITYNANGGDGDDVVVEVGNDGESDLLVNEPIVALSNEDTGFTRTGYEFDGWNTDPDGEGLAVDPGKDIAGDLENLEKNTDINTLYAQWKAVKYTVVYTDGVEDEEIFADQKTEDLAEGDDTPEFEGDDPTREDGYVFDGWDPEVKDKVSGDDADEDYVITYTAKWKEQTFTVTYEYTGDVPDGAPEVPEAKDYKVGEEVPAADEPVVDGYTFSGWQGEVDTMPAEDVTVTGSFTANADTPYTVEHYKESADGGYELADTDELTGETDTEVTAEPKEYERYTLNESAEGTKTSGTILGDGSLVLKLYYDMDRYTITYDLNGGEYDGSTENIVETYTYETEIIIHDAPTREGYEFLYWQGSEYYPGDTYDVTEDHVFTAQWEKVEEPVVEPDDDEEEPEEEPEEELVPDDEEQPEDDADAEEAEKTDGAKTGDDSNVIALAALAMTALAMLLALALYRRKQERE